MLASSHPGKILRYDWVEKAYKYMEEIRKKYMIQKVGIDPTKVETELEDNNKMALGAIDLDNDKNFNVQEDEADADGDDESNLEDWHGLEVSNIDDPLSKTINRIQERFSSQFIKDINNYQSSLRNNHIDHSLLK